MTLPTRLPAGQRLPVYAVHSRQSTEAELRCAGKYDHGRDCRRLLLRVYAGTLGRLELYCTRCHQHHRVTVEFLTSTGAVIGPQ